VQEPLFPLTDRRDSQFHDRIGYREFGESRRLAGSVFAEP
jgi:hypothetical protein